MVAIEHAIGDSQVRLIGLLNEAALLFLRELRQRLENTLIDACALNLEAQKATCVSE